MSKWYLKIGNSRLVAWNGKSKFYSFETSSFFPQSLLRKLGKVDRLYFFSVVPKVSQKIIRASHQKKIKIHEVTREEIPVRAAYKKNIGIDRLLNVYSASLMTKKNIVVLDIGTALTVDFLTKRGVHLGGWISAGPHLIAKALTAFTSKLPLILPRRINRNFGTNTRESLLIGHRAFLHGMILVAESIGRGVFGRNFEIFVTGGGAPLLSVKSGRKIENLALRGLKDLVENKYGETTATRIAARSSKNIRS